MTELLISKITSKSQTVIPKEVREKLSLHPGDVIRYKITNGRVEMEKLRGDIAQDDPFFTFTEWASPTDEEAYKDL